jgi:hypothetical protein
LELDDHALGVVETVEREHLATDTLDEDTALNDTPKLRLLQMASDGALECDDTTEREEILLTTLSPPQETLETDDEALPLGGKSSCTRGTERTLDTNR